MYSSICVASVTDTWLQGSVYCVEISIEIIIKYKIKDVLI